MPIDRCNRKARALLAALLLALLVGPAPGTQDRGAYLPARSLEDARLRRLREASASWELRTGPRREVVDVACLVPDAATFYRAIATWDESHWFPVLIEDVEYTSKFLRAFRPSRVVRFPDRGRPSQGDGLWSAAITAVGRSWTATDDSGPAGDRFPRELGRTPPGVVVSNPASPSLPGAVALAAGRFQPLIRWEPGRKFDELLSDADAQKLARQLRATLSSTAPNHDLLGDDCDFITLALDYPYRYQGEGLPREGTDLPPVAGPGPAAFDDLIGRHLDLPRPDSVRIRWAFAGRLTGDEVRSAYAAMCSLFLRPERATLINAYGDGAGPPFGDYRQSPAADRLDGLMEVSRRDRGQSDLSGWHSGFDPVNRAGLVLINSSGNASDFNLGGPTPGRTWDVPITEPAAVYKVHSHSAADPGDAGTIAGRWLANGAYLYFGSVHEPFLSAFRTPELVVNLLLRGIPFGAAARMLPEELTAFGNSWRLAYLGDPLFRLDPDPPGRRLPRWEPLADWPVYDAPGAPADPKDPFAVLSWALRVSIDASRRGEPAPDAVIDALRAVDPASMDGPIRAYRDLLLADALFLRDRLDDLRADFGRRPPDSLSPAARRWLETARVVSLQRALDAGEWEQAASIWSEVAGSSPPAAMLRSLADRVRPAKDQTDRRASWRRRLTSARGQIADDRLIEVIDEELARP
ncbi:hypothetical protein [Tautonia plasticadhaerens]|uniref:Uncharacterized protein n=1 Tax=Tautonia plasticadhaerens TaxID=2527974 RepID=A0A518HBC8_9BACT|nr:hypothetical protein [Tautonia plasticadhaerens]QDV38162.1 hypothetical protein ElP_61110 [Tautonia plasticadhaerens]